MSALGSLTTKASGAGDAGDCPYLCPVVEACPGCDQTDGVEQTCATARVEAWKCTRCGTAWAISLVNPHLPRDRAEQVGAARWILGQIMQLADEMPKLIDEQLRTRLRALAESCAR